MQNVTNDSVKIEKRKTYRASESIPWRARGAGGCNNDIAQIARADTRAVCR